MNSGVTVIAVPYDSGQRGVRMGAGPLWFLDNGAADVLSKAGFDAGTSVVESPDEFRTEIATSFALNRIVAALVADASKRGNLPIVLSGNCGTAIGTVSGLNAAASARAADRAPEDIGVIWFDAHGDLNTPESTTSGFLDGMSLATLTGRCWTALASSIPGFRPVPDEHVIIAGARDMDAAEISDLARSRIAVVAAAPTAFVPPIASAQSDGSAATAVRASLIEALDRLRTRVDRVYLHIDLDVHDAGEARANSYAQRGGFGTESLLEAVRDIADRFTIAAASLTAYDPAFDNNGRMLAAGLELIRTIASAAYATDAGTILAE